MVSFPTFLLFHIPTARVVPEYRADGLSTRNELFEWMGELCSFLKKLWLNIGIKIVETFVITEVESGPQGS